MVVNKIEQKNKAFTLAEVLLTLGIIGVVAAMTIPNLVKYNQKQQTISRLKKSYANLSQVVRQSEQVNGYNDTWDWGTSGDADSVLASFNTYWRPYLKIMKNCSSMQDCGYKSGIKDLTGAGVNGVYSPTTRVSVMLADGFLLIVWSTTKSVVVDINAGIAPNIYGIDVFNFVLDAKKGLVPLGATSDFGSNCKTYGQFCAAKIIADGWQIKDDYPWR